MPLLQERAKNLLQSQLKAYSAEYVEFYMEDM